MRRGDLVAAGCVAATAGCAGALLAGGHARVALLVGLAPIVVLLGLNFRLAALLLAVSLPFPLSLVGGGSGISVAMSDLLLALLVAVIAVDGLQGRTTGLGAAVKPVLLIMSPYLAWLAVLLAAHPGLSNVLQTAQRLELFLVPVLVGAAIGCRRLEWPVLRAYVVAAAVFAVLYPLFSNGEGGLGAQKNPAGQFIANALILLTALKPLQTRRLLPLVPLLTFGLFWTMSRGAIASVGVAVAVLMVAHRGDDRRRFAVALVPLAVVVVVAFSLLPQDAKDRNTDFSTTSGTAAAASLEYRNRYKDEARQLIRQEPVFGVGVGNYGEGTATFRPSVPDPHQVLFLQAAEGGYPLAAAFVAMTVGSVLWLGLRSRRDPMAAAAGAVLSACAVHGLVDVYWVRGTPVLGWVLVGVALGLVGRRPPERDTHGRGQGRVLQPIGGGR